MPHFLSPTPPPLPSLHYNGFLCPKPSTSHTFFVYTQCQAIHACVIFPCQDTPIARIRYFVRVNIPLELFAVMAAHHVEPHGVLKGGW
ncbi:Leukotriene A-4 hydrolase-like [Spatholobus suberectus]|nr:Leukotriene A-4 hydrolase-like [Spatholobus suberectus]